MPCYVPGFYFDHPEIVPHGVQGDFRFNKTDEVALRFASHETEVCIIDRLDMIEYIENNSIP